MKIDARGLSCPLPVVNTKNAMKQMTQPGEVEVIVDNEIAVQNLCKFAKQKGYEAENEKLSEDTYQVKIKVSSLNETKKVNEESIEEANAEDELLCNQYGCEQATHMDQSLVVLSANMMGTGEEELGKTLMKTFIFALTKQDVLPKTILLYNSGAYLSCEGSDSLSDLQELESEGVEILTCGTCLNYYDLSEKLSVGSVTNMYDIVEKMFKAKKVIRP